MPRHRLPRRHVLASLAAAPVSIFPSGTQAHVAPRDAAVPVVETQWLLDIVLSVRLAAPVSAARGSAFILGGRASGPLLDGMVLPGNLEWSVDDERGTLRWMAQYDLDAEAMRIHVADRAWLPVPAASFWSTPFSTSPDLEAINAPTALRSALHLGRVDASGLAAGRLRMNIHRVL